MSHEPGTVMKPLVALGKTPDDCWQWLGAIGTQGCAHKQYHGRQILAKRWMWIQLFGVIPEGLVITNTCNDKTCVNPFHLRACTQADACRGSVQTVLLPADVVEIKRAKKTRNQFTATKLAAQMGCSVQTIRDIWRGRSWRNAKVDPNKARAARKEVA